MKYAKLKSNRKTHGKQQNTQNRNVKYTNPSSIGINS